MAEGGSALSTFTVRRASADALHSEALKVHLALHVSLLLC